MKKMKFLVLFSSVFLMFHSTFLWADDFLKAPLIHGGKTIQRTETRLEMTSQFSHDQAVKFYKEAFNGQKDVKFRDLKDATYIEDDGSLPWHSITISKQDKKGTNIVIVKDNWTWILGTLLLRFIGVFVVLLFLLLGMSLSGAIISRSVKKIEEKKS